jgi:hypothetical protein
LGRCDPPYHGIELRAIGGADAIGFRLCGEVVEPTCCQRFG